MVHPINTGSAFCVVYKANNLAKLVDKKKSSMNWLAYYRNKYEKNPSKKPTTKTGFWGFCGKKVDAIDYCTNKLEKLGEKI